MTGGERVRAYYEDLNKGSAEAVSAHFTEDATHYYTRLGPHEGAETIGRYAAFGVEQIDAQWFIENLVEQGDQVALDTIGSYQAGFSWLRRADFISVAARSRGSWTGFGPVSLNENP